MELSVHKVYGTRGRIYSTSTFPLFAKKMRITQHMYYLEDEVIPSGIAVLTSGDALLSSSTALCTTRAVHLVAIHYQ